MKLKVLGFVGGAAALALASTTATAGPDVYIGLDFGAPHYVEHERSVVYYERYEPAPVHHYDYHDYYDYYDPYPRHYVYRPVREDHHDGHKHKRKHKHHHHR